MGIKNLFLSEQFMAEVALKFLQPEYTLTIGTFARPCGNQVHVRRAHITPKHDVHPLLIIHLLLPHQTVSNKITFIYSTDKFLLHLL